VSSCRSREPWQEYCPPWEVYSGENHTVRLVVEPDVTGFPMVTDPPDTIIIPLGPLHCMFRACCRSENPSVTEMEHTRARISPANELPSVSTEAVSTECLETA